MGGYATDWDTRKGYDLEHLIDGLKPRAEGTSITAEARLCLNIILQALRDIEQYPPCKWANAIREIRAKRARYRNRSMRELRDSKAAVAWLNSESIAPWSFLWCADHAEIAAPHELLTHHKVRYGRTRVR
jgi:hypothetical protein